MSTGRGSHTTADSVSTPTQVCCAVQAISAHSAVSYSVGLLLDTALSVDRRWRFSFSLDNVVLW